jgi:hypothetical protein
MWALGALFSLADFLVDVVLCWRSYVCLAASVPLGLLLWLTVPEGTGALAFSGAIGAGIVASLVWEWRSMRKRGTRVVRR